MRVHSLVIRAFCHSVEDAFALLMGQLAFWRSATAKDQIFRRRDALCLAPTLVFRRLWRR
jgi:hypothetical protein